MVVLLLSSLMFMAFSCSVGRALEHGGALAFLLPCPT